MEQDNIFIPSMSEETFEEVPDQNPKYDMTEEELAAANAKIGGKPVMLAEHAEKQKKKRKTVMKNGRKLYYRSPEDYQNIWESFLVNEEEAFRKLMGYGKTEIEKIGVEKFIDAFDWPDALSVDSYRTVDVFHIIPCPHCGRDFGNAEDDFGLCTACKDLYDLTFLEEVITATQAEAMELARKHHLSAVPNTKRSALGNFVMDPEFREKFLKTTLDQRDREREAVKGEAN
jgi:hypothetical protein